MHATSLTTLADRLCETLHAAYDAPGRAVDGAQPLRAAFVAFGRDARRALLPLEDAMAAGIEVLQWLLNRNSGISEYDASLAAGIALGWLIDDALGTSPIFILIGVALGVVAIVAYSIAKFHSALTIPNTARPNHDPDTRTKD